MAAQDQIDILRRLIADTVTPYTYTDIVLSDRIDAEGGNVNVAAAFIWREKAAASAGLVDVQEGNSRRSLGDLYEQALSMAKVLEEDSGTSVTSRPGRTRMIERP